MLIYSGYTFNCSWSVDCSGIDIFHMIFTRWEFQLRFIFTPICGEMIQFDEHIFQMGGENQLVYRQVPFRQWVPCHVGCQESLETGKASTAGDANAEALVSISSKQCLTVDDKFLYNRKRDCHGNILWYSFSMYL